MTCQLAGAMSVAMVMMLLPDESSAQVQAHGTVPANPSQPYRARTAGEFARECAGEQAGCADIIGKSLMDKIAFAPSSNLSLRGPDYAHRVAAWLNEHPKIAAMVTEDGIYLALKSLYSCGGLASH